MEELSTKLKHDFEVQKKREETQEVRMIEARAKIFTHLQGFGIIDDNVGSNVNKKILF